MIKILFVDDEPSMLDQAQSFLSKESDDFDVDTAISGKKALDRLSDKEYDIVVTDYKMPKMDGIELLKHMRERNIDIPYIILTAAGDEKVAMNALNYGADRYIIKEGKVSDQFKILSKEIQQEVEHHRTKSKLIETEKRYRNLVKNVPVGIYKTKPDGRIVNGNKTLADILGYSGLQELKLADAFDIFVDPEDRKKWMREMKEKGVVENFEYRVKKPSGEVIWVKDTARAVRDDKGNIDHFNGIIKDVTEIKEMEEELGQSKEWLSLTYNILDSFADPIITTDKHGNIAFINNSTEELFGIERNEVVGDGFDHHFNLFSKRSGEMIDDPVDEILDGKKDFLKDEILLMKSKRGKEDVIFDGNPIVKKSGNILGTILTIKKTKDLPEMREKSVGSRGIEEYLDDLETGIVVLNSDDYTPINFNHAALQYLEYTEEKFKNISIFDWFLQKDESFTYESVKESLAEKGHFSTRVIKRYKNGIERILSFNIKKITDNSQDKILLSIFDISQEVEEMKRINQKSSKYRKVFNSVDEGVVVGRVIEGDTEKPFDITILDINSAFQDLMGVERGEVLGKKWSDRLSTLDDDHLDKIGSAVRYSSSKSFKLVDNKTNKKIDVKVVPEKGDRVILVFEKPYP